MTSPDQAGLVVTGHTATSPREVLEIARAATSIGAGASYAGKGLSLSAIGPDDDLLVVMTNRQGRQFCAFPVTAAADEGRTRRGIVGFGY